MKLVVTSIYFFYLFHNVVFWRLSKIVLVVITLIENYLIILIVKACGNEYNFQYLFSYFMNCII